MAAAKNDGDPPVKVIVFPQGCDSCGHVEGRHVADAAFEIRTKAGSLFMCGHHFRRNELRFVEARYEIREWSGGKGK